MLPERMQFEKEDTARIGENIRAALRRIGYSQEKLARIWKMSAGSTSRKLNGGIKITGGDINQIIEQLGKEGVTEKQLLEGVDVNIVQRNIAQGTVTNVTQLNECNQKEPTQEKENDDKRVTADDILKKYKNALSEDATQRLEQAKTLFTEERKTMEEWINIILISQNMDKPKT